MEFVSTWFETQKDRTHVFSPPSGARRNLVPRCLRARKKFLEYRLTTPPLKSNELVPGPGHQQHPNMFRHENYATQLLINLNFLRQSAIFCDVEIVAANKVVKAHRAVLSASSPYFHAMFTAGLLEERKETIELHCVAADILHNLIEFIYTGEVWISQENVQEMMVAADMLQLKEVVQDCTDFLKGELHVSNAIGIYRFAEGHNFEDLAKVALDFIHRHFSQICSEEEFLELPKDHLINFLSSENLRVDTESQVFQAAMRWIVHDVGLRRSCVFEILSQVRLPLLSICLLERAISDCNDGSLKVALRSIRKDLATKRGSLVPLNARPRLRAKKDIYVIGGYQSKLEISGNIFESVVKFDTFMGQWFHVAPMAISRTMPGVAALNGRIYVVGGDQYADSLYNGEVYSLTDSWSPIASMVVPRCEFGLCALHGDLYALGGAFDDDDVVGSIEHYDALQDMWRLEGSLPEPRFGMGVVSYEGLIYMVGGCIHDIQQDLHSYNPITGEWTMLAPMAVPRIQMGVAVLDDHLYVVGGTTSRNEEFHFVERYSFQENKWSSVPAMSVRRTGPAVAAADGLLYVIGGEQFHKDNFSWDRISITSVECYDPLSDTWRDCPPLPESRSEASAIAIDP